jgi:hypothetical protein
MWKDFRTGYKDKNIRKILFYPIIYWPLPVVLLAHGNCGLLVYGAVE